MVAACVLAVAPAAPGVDCMPGDHHPHRGGLAGAGGHLDGHPKQVVVEVSADLLSADQQITLRATAAAGRDFG